MKRTILAAGASVVIVVAAVLVVVNRPTASPGGAGGSATPVGPVGPTVPIVGPSVVGDATCADLKQATSGSTIALGGAVECDVTAAATDVTVTGSATGWLRCRQCTRWHLSKLAMSGGNGTAVVQMVGGDGWTIEDSDISGAGGPGNYGVVAVGETPQDGAPTNWTIRRSTLEEPGNNDAHQDNQDHALYVIGPNDTELHGVIEDNEILGGPAGHALKLGGTGTSPGQPDSTDSVVVRRNHIVGQPVPDGKCAVVIATNSDDISLENNRIDCPGGGVPIALGQFTGQNLRITDNVVTFTTRQWIVARGLYPGFDDLAPFDCGRWATCSGNSRG